jgi:uncharacterized protein (TIGR00251 family)
MKFPFLSETSGGIRLALYVQPNAPMSKVVGVYQDRLKIKIQAVPADGRANAEVVSFLSEVFSVPPSAVEILSGTTGRNKYVMIAGQSLSTAMATLAELAEITEPAVNG